MSSDRLFRVRSKQPYTSDPQPKTPSASSEDPAVLQSLEVGDICIFKDPKTKCKIGRVLQFAYYLEKTKSAQQYRSTTVSLTDKPKKIGVLCSWYSWLSPSAKFSMVQCEETHEFIPVTSYVCTLSHGCFEKIEIAKDVNVQSSIMNQDHKKLNLATAQNLTLTPSAVSVIQTLLSSLDTDDTRNDPHRAPSGTEENWVKYGTVALSRKDMQQILGDKGLSDLHVDPFQNLVKTCFPHIHGLQSTLFQLKSPLQCQEPGAKCLQIIHTRQSHWAALQVSGSDVCLYDSAYSSTSTDALQVIAQLVRSKNRSIQIQVMNIAKQTGATD